MTDYNKDFNEVMDLLKTVPGVNEHLETLQVKLGKQILKRRLELGWTQTQLVEECKTRGIKNLTQPMLSKIESGTKNIESNTYEKVLQVLGGIEDLDIKFGHVQSIVEKKV